MGGGGRVAICLTNPTCPATRRRSCTSTKVLCFASANVQLLTQLLLYQACTVGDKTPPGVISQLFGIPDEHSPHLFRPCIAGIYIHIYLHICIYIHMCIHAYIYTYTCICVHEYICVYIYIHTHTQTHTHVYIYVFFKFFFMYIPVLQAV